MDGTVVYHPNHSAHPIHPSSDIPLDIQTRRCGGYGGGAGNVALENMEIDPLLKENLLSMGAPAGMSAEAMMRLLTNQMVFPTKVSPLMWQWGTSFELESIQKFTVIAEKAIKAEVENFDQYIKEKSGNLEGQELQEYLFDHSDEFERVSVHFAQIHRSSIFLRCYGLLERILHYISEDFALWNETKIQEKDLKGQGIERTKEYLSKVHDFDFAQNNILWSILKRYGRIRNLFAHTYGDLPDDPSERARILEDLSHLEFIHSDSNDIILEENFNSKFFEILRTFFDDFFARVEEYIKKNPAKVATPKIPT
jgi:hypothetical protein